MTRLRFYAVLLAILAAAAGVWPLAAQNQQPEIELVIGGDGNSPPHYAVPDFLAGSPEAAELASTISQVLWDDLAFEREFDLIPRDIYKTIPAARSGGPGAAARRVDGAGARRATHGRAGAGAASPRARDARAAG